MQEQQALTVTQALQLAKNQLEGFTVHVIGEVSSCSKQGNWSAVYFSLGDKSSLLNCMMWNAQYESCGIELVAGMLVEVTGKFNVYPKKGTLSLSVSRIEPAGEGVLRAAVAQRLARLQQEGLTDESRKKPLPVFPEKVGVITSPQGKVIHDVLRTFRRRYPAVEVLFFGTKVEGDDAPQSIAHAIDVADASGCDVLLVIRGGGSYEDLLPFSSEEVAYAIARAQTPVISGVGHEPDVTIADYVADRRASTPTGAAEMAVPSSEELLQRLEHLMQRGTRGIENTLHKNRSQLNMFAVRDVLRDPYYLLYVPGQNIDNLKMRLDAALPKKIEKEKHALAYATTRFVSIGKSMLKTPQYAVAKNASRLEDLSPLKILTRGYAAVFDEGNKVVSSVNDVKVSERIKVKVLDGIMNCEITDIQTTGGLHDGIN